MAEKSDVSGEGAGRRHGGTPMTDSDVSAWFVREVLPLEVALVRFLRRGWRNESDIKDLRQDVYAEVYEEAKKEIPRPAKPFVFTVARNLLIDRARRAQVVSIDAVADLDALGIAVDEPGPDRSVMARQELHQLQSALNRLPHRWRDAVIMRKIECLSRQEIAARMGIAEATVSQHLAAGMAALTNLFHDESTEKWRRP
ncbi:MAG TPA: RNA polymerase sigma factor [Rhizomicrobium sp.]